MPMPITITATEIEAVQLIATSIAKDNRGFFKEMYSQKVWEEAGFSQRFVQDNLSWSRAGVVRGMHYQLARHAMGKLVFVAAGAIFDVAVDLRRGSPTFAKWVGRTLSAENGLAMWVPGGFAHGFLALEDSLVWYKCTAHHVPEAERCLHYKDPTVAIRWPFDPTLVSERDASAPFLPEAEYDFEYEG